MNFPKSVIRKKNQKIGKRVKANFCSTQKDRNLQTDTYRQTKIKTIRQTETDRQTNKQTEIDKLTDKQTETDIQKLTDRAWCPRSSGPKGL